MIIKMLRGLRSVMMIAADLFFTNCVFLIQRVIDFDKIIYLITKKQCIISHRYLCPSFFGEFWRQYIYLSMTQNSLIQTLQKLFLLVGSTKCQKGKNNFPPLFATKYLGALWWNFLELTTSMCWFFPPWGI